MSGKDGGWLLPEVIDPERICVQLHVPNDPRHLQAFWGAIYELTCWWNWQRDEAKTGRELARVWMDVYFQSRTLNDELEACGVIQDVRFQNCELQVLVDGVWQSRGAVGLQYPHVVAINDYGDSFRFTRLSNCGGDIEHTYIPFPEPIPGAPGQDGQDGQDGASPEMRVSNGYIQWRQDDDSPTWTNLVALDDLRGPQGLQGLPGLPGQDGAPGPAGPPGEDGEDCDCRDQEPSGPPPGPPSDDKRCKVATRMTDSLHDMWDTLLANRSSQDLALGLAAIIAGIAALFTGGVAAIVFGVFASVLGGVALLSQEAIDSDDIPAFWDEILCLLYALLNDNADNVVDILPLWKAQIQAIPEAPNIRGWVGDLVDGITPNEWSNIAIMAALSNVSADCSGCNEEPEPNTDICLPIDFKLTQGGFELWEPSTPGRIYGAWVQGSGWEDRRASDQPQGLFGLYIRRMFQTPITIVSISLTVRWRASGNDSVGVTLHAQNGAQHTQNGSMSLSRQPGTSGTSYTETVTFSTPRTNVYQIRITSTGTQQTAFAVESISIVCQS